MSEPPDARPIEVGLILAGPLAADDEAALARAREALGRRLAELFPDFDWRLPLVRREELAATRTRAEPVRLLLDGAEEREAARWDFGIVITPSDLVARSKPFALAVISRAMDLAVVSMARIDPGEELFDHSKAPEEPGRDRIDVVARRLTRLMLHALGHLSGLDHTHAPDNLMCDLETVSDLSSMDALTDEQREAMAAVLREVGDPRLEERAGGARASRLGFYLRGVWINRYEIADAVLSARPWLFPVRLTRLTTAAMSTLVVLSLTAETWDLALNQTPARIGVLLLLALGITTLYVTARQQLLVRRARGRLTEQVVVTNVSSLVVVACGMLTMALILLVLSFAGTLLLHRAPMVASWAASVEAEITLGHYALLAGFVTSLGLVIGALGASFEDRYDFRHTALVDEET